MKLHGLDKQNAFLSKKGYTDVTFDLKLALQSRKEFGLDTSYEVGRDFRSLEFSEQNK